MRIPHKRILNFLGLIQIMCPHGLWILPWPMSFVACSSDLLVGAEVLTQAVGQTWELWSCDVGERGRWDILRRKLWYESTFAVHSGGDDLACCSNSRGSAALRGLQGSLLLHRSNMTPEMWFHNWLCNLQALVGVRGCIAWLVHIQSPKVPRRGKRAQKLRDCVHK